MRFGWLLAQHENASLAQRLIREACLRQVVEPGQLVLHADRGAPMTSKTLSQVLADLGVEKTHSRPHVCDDNPFSESQFKTLKYSPGFPDRFGSPEHAHGVIRPLFRGYNHEQVEMSADKNRAAKQRYIEPFNRRDLTAFDDLFAPEYVLHATGSPEIRGPAELRSAVAASLQALSNVELTAHDMVAEGGKVATRWTIRAQHTGEFMGVPPTGKDVTFSGTIVDRLELRSLSPVFARPRRNRYLDEPLLTAVMSSMTIAQSKLTAQGQISVPAAVRKKLGIGPGSTLEWQEEGDKIVVRRIGRFTSTDLHAALFSSPPEPRSLAELKDGLRTHAKRRHARR